MGFSDDAEGPCHLVDSDRGLWVGQGSGEHVRDVPSMVALRDTARGVLLADRLRDVAVVKYRLMPAGALDGASLRADLASGDAVLVDDRSVGGNGIHEVFPSWGWFLLLVVAYGSIRVLSRGSGEDGRVFRVRLTATGR